MGRVPRHVLGRPVAVRSCRCVARVGLGCCGRAWLTRMLATGTAGTWQVLPQSGTVPSARCVAPIAARVALLTPSFAQRRSCCCSFAGRELRHTHGTVWRVSCWLSCGMACLLAPSQAAPHSTTGADTLADLHFFRFSSGAWSTWTPTGSAPSARAYATMVTFPNPSAPTDCLLLYGGAGTRSPLPPRHPLLLTAQRRHERGEQLCTGRPVDVLRGLFWPVDAALGHRCQHAAVAQSRGTGAGGPRAVLWGAQRPVAERCGARTKGAQASARIALTAVCTRGSVHGQPAAIRLAAEPLGGAGAGAERAPSARQAHHGPRAASRMPALRNRQTDADCRRFLA